MWQVKEKSTMCRASAFPGDVWEEGCSCVQRPAVTMPGMFGFTDATQAVKAAFLSVALWWGVFTLFPVLWVPEGKLFSRTNDRGSSVVEGFRQLARTFRKARRLKTVFLFLLAYWFYIDGVDTMMRHGC